jgi:hypothetical protein
VRSPLEAQAMTVPRPESLATLAKIYSDNSARYRDIAKSINLQPQ